MTERGERARAALYLDLLDRSWTLPAGSSDTCWSDEERRSVVEQTLLSNEPSDLPGFARQTPGELKADLSCCVGASKARDFEFMDQLCFQVAWWHQAGAVTLWDIDSVLT